MTNLTGYLLKFLCLSSIIFSIFFSPLKVSAASNDLVKKLDVNYTIDDNGNLTILFKNTLTKKTTYPTVITNYSYTLPIVEYNKIAVTLNGKSIKYTATGVDGGYKIYLTLSNTVVSKDSPVTILTSITKNSFITFGSENTHLVLPTLSDSQLSSAMLSVPAVNLGDIVWSNFKYTKSLKNSYVNYTLSDFPGENLAAVFGKSVGHILEIDKNIVNDSNMPTIYKITLPRDGDGQTVMYNSIFPMPYDIDMDEDKNLSFSYLVDAKSSTKVNIKAYITRTDTFYMAPKSFDKLLTADKYWAFPNDTEGKRVALYLRNKGVSDKVLSNMSESEFSDLVNSLYQYVLNRLTPIKNTDSSSGYQFIRQGVANIESSAKNGAYTDDYTDLMISLLRTYKIPSRMVLGYVSNLNNYNNAGFFHSWVEYWNSQTGEWVILDPALQDFYPQSFSATAYDHIALVVRTGSSYTPDSSIFSSDEFKVKVSDNTDIPVHLAQSDLGEFSKVLSKYEGSVTVENKGNLIMLIDGIHLKVGNKTLDPANIINTQIILPGQSSTLDLTFDKTDGIKNPQLLITLKDLNDNIYKYPKSIKPDNIKTNDQLINLGISFIIFLALMYIVRFVFRINIKKK